MSYLWYETNYWLSMVLMKLAFSFRAEGRENVPRSGPALLIANHQSYLDTVPVGLAARRHLAYLARVGLFRIPILSWIIRSLNAVPINEEGFAREGLKTVLELLQTGHAVIVYPEGERSWDGKMQPLRPGIHLLIKRVDMPIIPVGIAGTFEAWPRQHRLPRLAPLFWPARKGTVAVSVGLPIPSSRFKDQPREQVMDELFREVQRMKEQAERLRRK
jgi:1-acyl-sn-glycerol-3-phosphate acyltransferase